MTIYLHCQEENNDELFVSFSYTKERVLKIKSLTKRSWNPDKKQWIIPYSKEALSEFMCIFSDEKIVIDPLIKLEELNENFNKDESIQEILGSMDQQLILKGFSDKTKKVYLGHVKRFLRDLQKEPKNITKDDTQGYLATLLREQKKSHAYVNQALSSIKFMFKFVLCCNLESMEIPRPKKEYKLPQVLSQVEVAKILSSIQNIKHRAILFLTYSAGLRVSEVARLILNDIHPERKLIRIKQGKGRKDRYTLLSDTAMTVLNDYISYHKPKMVV